MASADDRPAPSPRSGAGRGASAAGRGAAGRGGSGSSGARGSAAGRGGATGKATGGGAAGTASRAARTSTPAGSSARQGTRRRDERVVSTHGFQAPGARGGSTVRPRGATGRTSSGRTSPARSTRPSARQPSTRRPTARRGAARPGLAGRRRLVGGVLVLAVLVALGVAAGYGLGRGVQAVRDVWPDPVPRLEAQKVAAPGPAEVGGPSRPCPASSLTLGLTPDHSQADVGEPFALVVTITNSGRRPCIVDGSGVNRRITVADAAGQAVWTSAHCTSGERQLLLGPGDVDSKTIRWSGKRSVEGDCTTGQAAVPAGTYTAQVSIASVEGAVGEPVTLTIGDPVAPSPAPAPSGAAAPAGGAASATPQAPDAARPPAATAPPAG